MNPSSTFSPSLRTYFIWVEQSSRRLCVGGGGGGGWHSEKERSPRWIIILRVEENFNLVRSETTALWTHTHTYTHCGGFDCLAAHLDVWYIPQQKERLSEIKFWRKDGRIVVWGFTVVWIGVLPRIRREISEKKLLQSLNYSTVSQLALRNAK